MDVYLYEEADPRIVLTVNEYNLLAKNKIEIDVHLHKKPIDTHSV